MLVAAAVAWPDVGAWCGELTLGARAADMSRMAVGSDSTPRFDHWGTDIVEPVPETPAPMPQGPDRRGRLPRPTRLRLFLVAVVTAAAVAGVVHVASSGSSQPTPAHLSLASERAVAAAINLRRSDVPGFAAAGSSGGVTDGGDAGAQFKKCFGPLPGGGSNNGYSSPNFTRGSGLDDVTLGSNVTFVTAAQLKRDVALARRSDFPRCFAQAFAAMTFKSNGVTITGSNARAQTLPTASATAAGVFPVLAMRASLTWTVRGIGIPVYFDLFLVGVGHDELLLYSFALEQPDSSAAEKQLVSVLVARALAQPH